MSVQINPGPPNDVEEQLRIKQSRGKVVWECYKCGGLENVSPDVEHLDHRHRGVLYILKRQKPEGKKGK